MAIPPNKNKKDMPIANRIRIITKFPFAQFFLFKSVPSLKAHTNSMIMPTKGNLVIKIEMAQSFTLST